MACYSAALIIIGCSFKTILHHYLDEEAVSEGKSIPEDEPQYDLEESARRIAHKFSWSMAASFFFLNVMILSHRGFKANHDRLVTFDGRINWPHVLIIIIDWALLIVMATFSQWITNLEVLSVAGCWVVLCQVIMRTRGLPFFPVSKLAMKDCQRWPNASEARSVPASN